MKFEEDHCLIMHLGFHVEGFLLLHSAGNITKYLIQRFNTKHTNNIT
jgi:hypothetical protein